MERTGVARESARCMQQRLLCQQSRFVKGAAEADADYDRRAGVRPGLQHGVQHKLFYAVQTVRRAEHGDAAHVLTAKSFWCYFHFNFIALYYFIMNNSRCIILCIFSDKRILYH